MRGDVFPFVKASMVPQSHSIVWSTLTGSFDKDNLKCLLSVKHKCIKWISQEGSVFIMHSI